MDAYLNKTRASPGVMRTAMAASGTRSLPPHSPLTAMNTEPPASGQNASLGFSPSMTRSAFIAAVAKLLPTRGVPRDSILDPQEGPTDWSGPQHNVLMKDIVRNGHADHFPLEFLVHDHKGGLVTYQMTKSGLFTPGRVTLGVYRSGERLLPAPPDVIRHLATTLDVPTMAAHLPAAAAAAAGGVGETKAEDFDITAVVGAAAAPAAGAATMAQGTPAGLARVAPYMMTEQVLAYLEDLSLDQLKELRALDWGFTPTTAAATGLGDDQGDWVTDIQAIIADARNLHASASAAARNTAHPDAKLHDGGADLTLRLSEIRRKARGATWLDDAHAPLTVSCLTPQGVAAMRAVLEHDAALEILASDIVTDFELHYPGHPLVAELKSALDGGSDERWARALARYRPGGFDKAFQTLPLGAITMTALFYCFSASKGGDRADLLKTVSDFRILVSQNIPSFDAFALTVSSAQAAASDLGIDALTDQELAVAICSAADASPQTFTTSPYSQPLVAAMLEYDEIIDTNDTPPTATYATIIAALNKCRTLAVRARSKLAAGAPSGNKVLEVASTGNGGGGGGGGAAAEEPGHDGGRGRRNRSRGRGRGRARTAGEHDDVGRGPDVDVGRGPDHDATPRLQRDQRVCIAHHFGAEGCRHRAQGRTCRFIHGNANNNMSKAALDDALVCMKAYTTGFKIHSKAVEQYGIHAGMLNEVMRIANPSVPAAPNVNMLLGLGDTAAAGSADAAPAATAAPAAPAAAPSLRSILMPTPGIFMISRLSDDAGDDNVESGGSSSNDGLGVGSDSDSDSGSVLSLAYGKGVESGDSSSNDALGGGSDSDSDSGSMPSLASASETSCSDSSSDDAAEQDLSGFDEATTAPLFSLQYVDDCVDFFAASNLPSDFRRPVEN